MIFMQQKIYNISKIEVFLSNLIFQQKKILFNYYVKNFDEKPLIM